MYNFPIFMSEFGIYLKVFFGYGILLAWIIPYFSSFEGLNFSKHALLYSLVTLLTTLVLTIFLSPWNSMHENSKLILAPIFSVILTFVLSYLLFSIIGKQPFYFKQYLLFDFLFHLPLLLFTVFVYALGSAWKN